MSDLHLPSAQEERKYHTYVTHRIPWYVRLMWVCFWVGMIWYLIQYAIPMARNYF
jgi:hypothetical protein